MGIVNVTPDSFSDGGDFADHQPAVRHGQQMADQGAAILDIGGESTRPGASTPSTQEEMNRITPVIKALSNSNSLISVDTRRAEVMEAAVTAGASIINDVSALTGDNDSLSFVAARQLPTVLMHMQGTPETMQQNPVYDHVALDIYDFLQKRMEACVDAGLLHSNIAVDPGIGFGKTIAHNLTLINWLSLLQGLGCPIVMGLSRKGFIGKLSQAPNPKDRLPGTLSANLASLSQGAQILRVHDVKEHVQAIGLWQALQQNSSDVTTNQ
jgi:dihydropteroate synthase